MTTLPHLSLLTFLPLVGGLVVFALARHKPALAPRLALGFSILSLLQAIGLWFAFAPANLEFNFLERHPWIPALGVEYYLGVDGLGMLMVLLTAIVVPPAILASSNIGSRPHIYFGLVLWLEAGLFGAFTALNFFHWFIFWELSLLPAFFLVRLWGGPGKASAATQFFVYTMVGSVAMLLAFLAIYRATGTFAFPDLAKWAREHKWEDTLATSLSWRWLFASESSLALGLFALVFLGFAVKVPLVPFHTWLPAAYAEAPTGTTMLLTGLMSKMGVYGLLRILVPVFPDQIQAALTPLLVLAVLTIVASAAAAFAQRDLKRMLAYSSVNHLGYCLLGICAAVPAAGSGTAALSDRAATLNGVMLQMFNHGITASTLFCFIAFIERRSAGLRGLNDFGGLRKPAPVFCGLMGMAVFASLGLPGLNGFVGEFLIFKGAFQFTCWAAVLSALGLLLTAIFLLTLLQRVFHGPLNPSWAQFADLSVAERLVVLPGTAIMLVLGVYPQPVIHITNPTALQMVQLLSH